MRAGRAVGAAVLLVVTAGAACAEEAGDDVTGGTGTTAADGTTGTTAAAGTTGGDVEEQRRAYIDALVAASADDDLTPAQTTCLAESFVDGYGAEALAAAGVTSEDVASDDVDSPDDLGLEFSDEQAASFYDRLTACMDVKALFIASIAGGGVEQVPGLAQCLDENLTDDLIERIITIGYTQGEEGLDAAPGLAAEVEQALEPCLAPGP